MRDNHPLELVRALMGASTPKTWDPELGLFWEANALVRDLLPAGVDADETVTIVRHCFSDLLGLPDAPSLVEWEKARVRTHREVATLLKRAEERLGHGRYYRDDHLKLVYAADES